MDIAEVQVTILHFDDEVLTVTNIPDALFNLYASLRPEWVPESEIRYRTYAEEFVIRADHPPAVRVRYVLTPDAEDGSRRLVKLNPQSDIAVFDLMRENPETGEIDPFGKTLYQEALKRGFRQERVFILCGFPNIIAEHFSHGEYDKNQLLQKPITAAEMAGRLARLLPRHVQF